MRKFFKWIALLSSVALLVGCIAPTAAPVESIATFAAETVVAASSAVPTIPPAPAATSTVAETAAPASSSTPASVQPAVGTQEVATSEPLSIATQAAAPVVTESASGNTYLDDRSTPTGLIFSLFNAINRREYSRAYSYWENAGKSSNVPPFDQFAQGYQDTDSVQVTIGVVGGGNGAGQIYYVVPVVLQVQTTGGQSQIFAGCYTLHLARPEIQAAPPFQPMAIQKGSLKQAANTPNTDDLLANACNSPDVGQNTPLKPQPVTDPTTIAATNYLDDRSDAVTLLRSLFNAVNRKEYDRAYSYWETGAQNLPPFAQFQQGYQDTASVEVTFGSPTQGAAAGNLYWPVPTVLKSQTTGGQTQTFAGCYVIHLGEPANQTVPPFDPMAVQSAKVKQVDNNADVNNLLSTVCQGVP